MNALLTGSSGFVGSHMYRALEDHGYDVTGIDLLGTGRERGDCRDLFKTDDTRYDLVVHLAAIVGGRKTIEGEPLKVATDLAIDSDMFNWAARTKQKRVVYYSSSAAYPVYLQDRHYPQKLAESDINLKAICTPDASYGWSKLSGEMLAECLRAEGVATHVLRPFSGYGETQSLDYPFPSFIKRAAERKDPFPVWSNGNAVRDFIHIDDVVAATLAVVDQDFQEPVNLGWGRATSFNDLAELVMFAAGYSADIRHLLEEPEGVSYRVADTTFMNTIYTPKITLEEGISRALVCVFGNE